MKVIKNIKKSFSFQHRRLRDVGPTLVWNSILIFAILIFLILIVWSYRVMKSVEKDQFGSMPVTLESVDVIDEKTLNSVLQFYDKKAKRFKELKERPAASFADPSL